MEAIGTLAGGIAHDFNNILGSIIGYAELIRPAVTRDAGVVSDVDALLRAAERGKDLVTRILKFSRRQSTERQPIDLVRCVADANALIRATLPAGIEIQLTVPDGPARAAADSTSIHQVLMNLATNAAHAMEDGGVLGVSVEPVYMRDSAVARHPDLREGHYVRVSVTDTGIGMEPALLERVFEPFFTTKPPGSGSGLGLAMVHGIMQDHDGAVLITSEVGRGTQVQCYFPALDTEATQTTVDPEVTPLGNGERVLVVDDEPSLASLGERRLTGLGYVVSSMSDPLAALEYVRLAPTGVDLVITDYSMPRMNGLELARQIQTIRPGLPVMLTSGFSDGFAEGAQEAAGVRVILPKPARTHELAVAVREALRPREG
jgi:CheY-like chemotaxis protein